MGHHPFTRAAHIFFAVACTVPVSKVVYAQDQKAEPAAPASPAVDPLSQIIERLDSADVQSRTDATDRLRSDRAITLKMIESHLRSDTLSPEQRQRLCAVAFRKFREGPHAAMGLRNDQTLTTRGVTIAFLQPGFPASQTLKLNDRIVVAAGTTIDTWDKLRAVIISRDAGDEIPITVVREGATLNLVVKLGEYSRLNQSGGIEASILDLAWDLRSAAFRPPQDPPPAIASALAPVDWLRPESTPDDVPPPDYSGGDSSRTGIVAGGEPRGGVPVRSSASTLTRNFNNRLAPGQGPFIIPRQPGADAAQVQLQLQLQLQQFQRFQQSREALAAQLEANNRRLADPSTPQSAHAALRSENSNLIDGIRILDIQLQTIQAELKRLQQQR